MARDETRQNALHARQQDFSARPLVDRGEGQAGLKQQLHPVGGGVERPEPSGHVVAEQVSAGQFRQRRVAHDDAAYHRLAAVRVEREVGVREAGLFERQLRAGRVDIPGRVREHLTLGAFTRGPAVVAAGNHDVDLLPAVASDVGQVEVARGAVEGELPRVAETVRPDLGADLGIALGRGHERVVRRHQVSATTRRERVDAQYLAAQRAQVLSAGRRGVQERVRHLAVADAHVQHAVGAERHLTAVVERLRHGNAQYLHRARGVGARTVRVEREAGNDHVTATALRVGRHDVPVVAPGARSLERLERHREQPLFAHQARHPIS